MEQNPYALTANSICRFAPLRVTLPYLWQPFAFTQMIWGNNEVMVPNNQSTGQITLDRASIELGEMEINYLKFPIRKLKTGQKVSVETLEEFDAAGRKGMGISPFFNCTVNIGTKLSKALEKWVYTGDFENSLDTQSVRGFLNNVNTSRIRAPKSVDSMTGEELYSLINEMHSQLIMNIGNAEMYSGAGAKISVAIPSRYQKKLNELVTIPGGNSPLPVKVIQLIRDLPMVEHVNIVEPEHVAAVDGTTTNDGANSRFDANELCIFMGFNNPGLCGVGVDMMEVRNARSSVSRLLDESGRSVGQAEITIADEIAKDVKTKILPQYSNDERQYAEMKEVIDSNILYALNTMSEYYNGVAPSNIMSYRFEGWMKQWVDSNIKYIGVGSIYTAGGLVSAPGMMIAAGTQDVLI